MKKENSKMMTITINDFATDEEIATLWKIAERIIKEAVALLKQTDWTISEIALALGFIQSNYFSSFFKRHIGQTPQEYRRE